MGYGPTELSERDQLTRPYDTVRDVQDEQSRRATEMTEPPAKPKPQSGPRPRAGQPPAPVPVNPGPPMRFDDAIGRGLDFLSGAPVVGPLISNRETLRNIPLRAWESVQQIPRALVDYARATERTEQGSAGRSLATLQLGMSVAAPLAAPFQVITDAGREAVVESDDHLRAMRDQFYTGLSENERGDALARANVTNAVFDHAKDQLGEVANDPNRTPGDRLVAGIVSGLMQTQELAEFGAPSAIARTPRAIAWLRGNAPKVAEDAGLVAETQVRTAEKPAAKPVTAEKRVEGDSSGTPSISAPAEEAAVETPRTSVSLARKALEEAEDAYAEKYTRVAEGTPIDEAARIRDAVKIERLRRVAESEGAEVPRGTSETVLTMLNMPESKQTQNLGQLAQESIELSRRKAITQALRWGTIVDMADTTQVRRYSTHGETLLTHIDEMIDTIQNEVARGMASPSRFLDELLDARATISAELAGLKAKQTAAREALKTARTEESQAGAALTKATRAESSTERAARGAEMDVLKTDIQARSATAASEAKGAERVAEAAEQVEGKAETVAAQNLSDEERVLAAAAAAEQRIAELRQRAQDITLSAREREAARMEALRASIEQRRIQIGEEKAASADRTSFAGEDAPEYGYLNADDQAIFDRTNIHVGKQESPLVGETIAETLRRAEAAGEDIRKQHVSWDTVAGEMVRKFGESDPEALISKVQKQLRESPTKGEQAALYQAADKSITRLSENARTAFALGTEEEGKLAAARLLQFIEDFRDAVGESARATASRRLVNKTASADLIQGTATLRTSKARLASATKRLDVLDTEAEKARVASEERLSKIEQLEVQRETLLEQRVAAISQNAAAVEERARARSTERVRSLQAQIDAVDSLRTRLQTEHDALAAKWESRVQEALKEADEARTAHTLAQEQVALAAKALQESIIKRRAAEMALDPEKMRVILQLDPENVAGFVHAIRDQDIQKKGSLLNTYVLTNMFGGAGQIANAVSNITSLAKTELVDRPLSRVAAAVPLYRVNVGGRAAVVGGEVEASLAGTASALMDASRFVARTMAYGEDVATAAHRGLLEITTEGASAMGVSGRPAIAGWKGLPVEWPRRLLVSMDGFIRILGTTGEASARVYREAGGGKKGSEAVAKFKTDPSIKQLEMANEYSGRVTYNEPPTPGSRTALLVNLVNKEVGETGLRPGIWVIPVVRFGLNAASAAVRLSGGGLISGRRSALRAREALRVGNDEVALNLGRRAAMEAAQGAVGVTMLAGGFLLMDQGLLTGLAPTAPKELAAWKAQKKEEMSLNIAGRWVPLSLLGPAAAPFLLAVLLRQQSDPEKDGDRLERAAQGIAKFASDIPAVSGFYDLFAFMDSFARNGWSNASEAYLARLASRFLYLSSTGKALVPVFDDTVKDPEDFLQRLKANYPGLSTEVAPAIDPYTGDPLRRYSNPLGLSETGAQADPRAQSLIEAGHSLVRPSNVLAGEKLSDQEWHQYQSLAGQERDAALAAVQQSEEYRSEKDPKVRQAMLDLADSRAMDKARLAVALSMVRAARTPEENVRALKVLMVEGGSLGARALALYDFRNRLTPEVTAAIDASRTPNAQGEYPPAIADFLRAAPLVQQFLAEPPFSVGAEEEWRSYVQARALRTNLAAELREANNGRDVDARILANELRKRDARAAALLAKYDDARVANSARQRILDANPWLQRFVSSYKYTSQR